MKPIVWLYVHPFDCRCAHIAAVDCYQSSLRISCLSIRRSSPSPEDSSQGGIDGVPVVDVHVVPAALGGKVIEAQPECRVRAAGEHKEPIDVSAFEGN